MYQEILYFWGVDGMCGFIYWVWSVGVAFVPEPVLKKLEAMIGKGFHSI